MKRFDVLIVDDNDDLRSTLAEALIVEQLTFAEASSGQDAFLKLQASSFRLVISDVDMPNGDGVWLLKKCLEHFPSVPVVLYTGGLMDREAALNLGAVDLIRKPATLTEIRALLRNTLSRVLSRRR